MKPPTDCCMDHQGRIINKTNNDALQSFINFYAATGDGPRAQVEFLWDFPYLTKNTCLFHYQIFTY